MTSHDEPERCPEHPDLEPIRVTEKLIRSAQSNFPTGAIQRLRCPACY